MNTLSNKNYVNLSSIYLSAIETVFVCFLFFLQLSVSLHVSTQY